MSAAFPSQNIDDRGTAERTESIRTVSDAKRASDPLAGEKPNGEEAVREPKIAIIDDQKLNIKVVRHCLERAGYRRFFTTTDATEALSLIRQAEPDVVILDISMPQVSGLDILTELRNCEEFVDLPVLILTAAGERQAKLAALERGDTDFLRKPLSPVELESRVRNVLAVKLRQAGVKRHNRELGREMAVRSAQLAEVQRGTQQSGKRAEMVGMTGESHEEHLGKPTAGPQAKPDGPAPADDRPQALTWRRLRCPRRVKTRFALTPWRGATSNCGCCTARRGAMGSKSAS